MYKINIMADFDSSTTFDYDIFNFGDKYYVKKSNDDNDDIIYYMCTRKALIMIFERDFLYVGDFTISLYHNDIDVILEQDNINHNLVFSCVFNYFLTILDEFKDQNNTSVNKALISLTYNNLTANLPVEIMNIIINQI